MQPKTKMSSGQATFDLKAARQICDQATFQLTGAEIDEDLKILIDQANMLPAALDEIERLQADIITHDDAWHNDRAANAKRIAELKADLTYFREGYESEVGCRERVVAALGTDDAPWTLAQRVIERIAELEESLQRERAMAFSKIQRQRHAIARLSEAKRERGKALVEERAKLFHQFGDMELDSSEDDRRMAREQLRREDKL